MPNWINNTITGKRKILEQYVDNSGNFDFNKIIPMPTELNIESSTRIDRGLQWLYYHDPAVNKQDVVNALKANFYCGQIKDYLDISEEDIALSRVALSNYLKYGYTTWYNWCWDHWSTKWNACDTYIGVEDSKDDIVSVCFNTAYSTPQRIWNKIMKDNPNESFSITFNDESGLITTTLDVENGEVVDSFTEIEKEF